KEVSSQQKATPGAGAPHARSVADAERVGTRRKHDLSRRAPGLRWHRFASASRERPRLSHIQASLTKQVSHQAPGRTRSYDRRPLRNGLDSEVARISARGGLRKAPRALEGRWCEG